MVGCLSALPARFSFADVLLAMGEGQDDAVLDAGSSGPGEAHLTTKGLHVAAMLARPIAPSLQAARVRHRRGSGWPYHGLYRIQLSRNRWLHIDVMTPAEAAVVWEGMVAEWPCWRKTLAWIRRRACLPGISPLAWA